MADFADDTPPPPRVGTVTTVDIETGKVTAVKEAAMTLLPAPPGTCPECAVAHLPAQPHSQQSLFYQYAFHARHGRWPTWTDALSHCAPDVRAAWRAQLVRTMTERGIAIPDDLKPTEPAPPAEEK